MQIAYDGQIFRLQRNGGISKYFVRLFENIPLISKDISIDVVAGITQNEHLLNSNVSFSGLYHSSIYLKLVYTRFYNLSEKYNIYLEKKKISKKYDIIHQTYNGYEYIMNAKPKK